MLQNKIEFINVLHSILNAENDADMETIMMAMQGVMMGHCVRFIDFEEMYITADSHPEYLEMRDRYRSFDNMQDYFADCASSNKASNDIDHFASLCDECMNFDLMPYAKSLQLAQGPY